MNALCITSLCGIHVAIYLAFLHDYDMKGMRQSAAVMKIIIVGAGEIGRHLAVSLARESHSIVVIEYDTKVAEELEQQIDGRVLTGNGATAKKTSEKKAPTKKTPVKKTPAKKVSAQRKVSAK